MEKVNTTHFEEDKRRKSRRERRRGGRRKRIKSNRRKQKDRGRRRSLLNVVIIWHWRDRRAHARVDESAIHHFAQVTPMVILRLLRLLTRSYPRSNANIFTHLQMCALYSSIQPSNFQAIDRWMDKKNSLQQLDYKNIQKQQQHIQKQITNIHLRFVEILWI